MTVNITPLYLAALAVDAIPDLDAVGTRPPFVESEDFAIGCVLDSRGRRWVVKCPKNATAATSVEAEASLAPQLLEQLRAGNLPFDIVRPAGFAQVKGVGRAVVYPEPFGTAQEFDELDEAGARELGRALASIHNLPASVVDTACLPVYSAAELRERISVELDEADTSSFLPPVLRRRWDAVLADPELWSFEPRVVHGDVAGENFLWADGSITSVIGFSDSQVGDPAADFAPIVGYGDDFFDRVRESYSHTGAAELDDAGVTRAQFHAEYALVRWLMFGKRTSQPEIIAEARDMLRDLADDVSSETTPL